MGTQRNPSVRTRPNLSAALPPLSWRRLFVRNLSAGLIVALLVVMLVVATPSSNSLGSTALPVQTPASGKLESLSRDTQSSATSSLSAGMQNKTSTNVTVNGRSIAVPSNGTTQQTITSNDGSQTTITVSGSQHTSAGNSSLQTIVNTVTKSLGQEAEP
ncbi:MAG TPA: hypothetical protein VG992_02625 [Candidatus Saccharimonadales bacterium]|nr:hypothetical protein [Candidatus Saccharimonadales bacterium]